MATVPSPPPLLLSVSLGVAAAVHLDTLRHLLPALYGSLPSLLIVNTVFPVASLLFTLLVPYLPSLFLQLLPLVLPAVHLARLPLIDLLLLAVAVTPVRPRSPPRPILPAIIPIALPLALRIVTPFLPAALPWHFRHVVPHVIASLCITLSFSAHPLSLSSVSHSTSRPSSTRRVKRPSKSITRPRSSFSSIPLLLTVSLLLSLLISPSLNHLLRHITPRPLPDGYRILAQRRGPTGLVSVVELVGSHRMLVADLSVLGGYHRRRGFAPDSIFSQFHVHEAVRLTGAPGNNASARGGRNGRTLCMGVGVGVVARALRQHGCDVDAVELDRGVATFAKQWFDLPGHVHVGDARQFLGIAQFDFIVHDVFTGGAVSTELVSTSEIARLHRALTSGGVLAMNIVARTEGRKVAMVVFDRLAKEFEYVRFFSEGNDELDNVVLFASDVKGGVTFRQAAQKDFLNSPLREDRLGQFEKEEMRRGAYDPPVRSAWMEELALTVEMWRVGWAHARLMRVVHPKKLWPALLAAEKR